ncbi:protein of unknown function [Amycolatopsis marina]|uniref:DUF2020 domain-containing protein n=1 Tax=Amycolatopsis marina TaxID=490629 RepID=A0A1I0VZL0_9PSEU|nr:DUF2020 domain-containing protein [Amycolatopsis marina]SFA81791.1 protein of unknown function [Amycolatopsis marina]
MRRLVLITVVTAGLLVACGQSDDAAQDNAAASTKVTPSSDMQAPALPPSPEPAVEEPCPYLTEQFVEEANGQRVAKVSTSTDKPHPACFFYRADGSEQLSVHVYAGDPEVATGLVDEAAPVGTSNPASDPTGWNGGYQKLEDGAVYAVAKEGAAVIVRTNQLQSVKARTVAEEVISELQI